MCLLDDKTLVESVSAQTKPLVSDLKPKGQWDDADSPVQPCSIDLHIGKIFIPGKTGKAEGSEDCPLDLHSLEPGQTAVVSTLEELCLPSYIAAIGFPPNRVSVKGILMTNPGHVDPGYAGPMRFAIINMGRTDFVLRRGDPIVTLLFMRLAQPVQKDWLQRRGGKKGRPPNQEDLDRLSADFLDVGARARTAAKTEVENAGVRLKAVEVLLGLLTAVLSAIILAGFFWLSGVQELKTKVEVLDKSQINGVQELKTKVEVLEKSQINSQVQQQVGDIDRRLKTIEQDRAAHQTKSQASQQAAPKH